MLICFGARLEHEAAAGEEAGDVDAFARRCWREAQQAALFPLPVPPAPPARILPAEPGLRRLSRLSPPPPPPPPQQAHEAVVRAQQAQSMQQPPR
jgi:hypothetical protein